MKKCIGNIVVSSPNYKVNSYFNKCLSIDNIDETLPTIIIGLQNAKKIIKDFDILNKIYENGMLWWTFSKTERRNDHDKDISDFNSYCISNITSKNKYYFINYINLTYGKAKKCLKYIRNNRKKQYYIDNNRFVFVYDTETTNGVNYTYGFSLSTCQFFGIPKEKIISIIENNPNNTKISNFYHIPNNIKRTINDDIPNEMALFQYF